MKNIKNCQKKLKKLENFFDVERKKEELKSLEGKLSDTDLWNNPQHEQQRIEITRKIKEIKTDISKFDKIKFILEELKTIIELAEETQDDSLVTDFTSLITELENLINDVRLKLLMNSPYDRSNAIVTLHAGAGGTEACDWVEMLFRMYTRWANKKGFEVEIADLSKGEEAGIRSVTFIVRGEYAYGLLKGEEGVHRLVRISPFDANKRRHTSFASCDVAPEVEEEEIVIDEKDLKVETFRASGHGGQHLQKTESAVRITHVPTGIVVQCQSERSQLRNKLTALKILKSRLYKLNKEKENLEKQKERLQKGEIGWGRQTRSYVFMPYQLVKDNITGVEVTNVESVMDGEIDVFIQAYLEYNARQQLNKK